jgi:uncharacterized protein involved in exopolysaccharide biosynthesis
VPSKLRSGGVPSGIKWEDPYLPVTRVASARSPIGSALGSTVAALLALFLIPLSGSIYYALTTPDEYTGRALVQFRPRATDNGGVVGNETTASSAATYGAFLGTPSTVRSVAGQIGVRPLELRDNMTVQLIPATTSLTITFRAASPDVAARGASALAQIAVQRAADDPLVSATVLAAASVPEVPSGPPRTLIVAAGAMLGILLAATAYFLLTALRRSRRQSRSAQQPLVGSESDSAHASVSNGSDSALSIR